MSAIKVPDILIPRCDLTKWATVACDQFNADPEYWRTLREFVGDAPSSLNLVCPEIYISNDLEKQTESVVKRMNEYLKSGLFDRYEGFVLTVRTLGAKRRIGLVAAVDIEKYDWKTERAEIRATEETIEDRLPVRVAIRSRAVLELPHVLTLLDDRGKKVIEPLYARRGELKKLYDFDLNMGGGHVEGYLVEKEDAEKVVGLFDGFLYSEEQTAKYGYDAGVLLAVGDGNHSLATAKVYWENLKRTLNEKELDTHPARFALVEINNLYDDGIEFQPIHRLIYGMERELVERKINELAARENVSFEKKGDGIFGISGSFPNSELIRIGEEIAQAVKKAGANIEYIHGDERLAEAVVRTSGVGIVMPEFVKSELFGYMLDKGKLPKKAFSIGDGEFKRYYLESRLIKPED